MKITATETVAQRMETRMLMQVMAASEEAGVGGGGGAEVGEGEEVEEEGEGAGAEVAADFSPRAQPALPTAQEGPKWTKRTTLVRMKTASQIEERSAARMLVHQVRLLQLQPQLLLQQLSPPPRS